MFSRKVRAPREIVTVNHASCCEILKTQQRDSATETILAAQAVKGEKPNTLGKYKSQDKYIGKPCEVQSETERLVSTQILTILLTAKSSYLEKIDDHTSFMRHRTRLIETYFRDYLKEKYKYTNQ